VKYERKKIKYVGKTIAEKPEIIAEVDKKEGRKTEIAYAYGIPLSTTVDILEKLGFC
jgi:hypothetical protein